MEHYDLIIIGTGAAGGTLAYKLAPSGKKILILERGSFLPREKENWSTAEVYLKERYHNPEVWYTPDGTALRPGMTYNVGGNTKVYGAALFRLRERDFERVEHVGGISPEWPLKYRDFEPYYTQAEQLYHVHGQSGLDPTEPYRSTEYPFPAVTHEPRIQEVHNALLRKGLQPYYTPLGIQLNEAQRYLSRCIRCSTCDGYPCLVQAKADGEVNGVLPALAYGQVTLLTDAQVLRLHTNASGHAVSGVEVEIAGAQQLFTGDLVVVACGAINSAALLLRSANEQHPQGLANSSDLVGRHFMKHQLGSILGVTKKLNPTVFQKTMALNDFYWGEPGFDYPMGNVQLLGKFNADVVGVDSDAFKPLTAEYAASHSVDWWITSEDLPDPNNRIRVKGEQLILDYTENNTAAYDRLLARWTETLKSIDCGEYILPCTSYFRSKLPVQGVGHQCGTCRFGEDPTTSVLDLHCRTHDLDNLYVVDGSFFPSSAAVNPTLTIIANALRVGDHLLERLI
ncbi:GMC family oxidoreductase [Anthocerotibacter panamensis]|uniref:GMC family oxidoreductase n=1 Tax=Anthocerotibacter panamensis TaxID=2857077 RepID=UPI001C407E80|nr:GMC family oxidoreductase [Anthocerotibacter panamensis]